MIARSGVPIDYRSVDQRVERSFVNNFLLPNPLSLYEITARRRRSFLFGGRLLRTAVLTTQFESELYGMAALNTPEISSCPLKALLAQLASPSSGCVPDLRPLSTKTQRNVPVRAFGAAPAPVG